MQLGSQGVKIVKPGDVPDFPTRPGTLDADVDSGDDIQDYDENVVRSNLEIDGSGDNWRWWGVPH